MPRKCAIYCRISQDRVGAGLGVERQRKDCEQLAASLGLTVVETYVDNDTSAFSGRPRPAYERLLGDVEDGHVDVVIAWHADRLHRSPAELENYIAVCDPRGVPTYTVRAGEMDLSTASGRMTARIIGSVARHESEQKGERVRRAKQQAQAAGKWLGGRRPFGFEPDAVTERPAEAEAIRTATRDVLAGDSLRSVARRWNDAGLTTATGKVWSTSAVRTVLLRPRNAGLVGNGDRIIGEAAWPPLVERDTWEALRALLTQEGRLTHRGTSRKLVGSFLYFCECGERVTSGGTRADGSGRYACPTMHMRRKAEPIDEMVRSVIAGVLRRDGVRLISPAENVQPLRDRLAVLNARAEEIAAMLGDPESGMTASQFRVANERVQGEIRQLEAEIGRKTAGSALAGIADAPDPGEAFARADIDRQRAIIDMLCTVTIRRARPGHQGGGSYFDPESVVIEPRSSLAE